MYIHTAACLQRDGSSCNDAVISAACRAWVMTSPRMSDSVIPLECGIQWLVLYSEPNDHCFNVSIVYLKDFKMPGIYDQILPGNSLVLPISSLRLLPDTCSQWVTSTGLL